MEEEYYCNEDIHKYMRENNEYEEGICLFCNLQLEEYKPKTIQKCCENPNFIFDKGRVCINCGIIDFNYTYIIPYINFHENKYKFRIKTIYNPKYWILKTLDSYEIKQITYNTQDKILRICKEIYKIEYKRNRMVSINYIIRCIFKMMKRDYEFIPLPKSQKTRMYYKKWWETYKNINRR